jgi:paraquat-inducible protein B
MKNPPPESQGSEPLPQAVIKRRRRISIVWAIPLVAAVLAGVLFYQKVIRAGPKITLLFEDANGVRPGQTFIFYRGVRVGEVRSVTTSRDQQKAVVEARLMENAAPLARAGSVFWIVRPELSGGNFRGLGTIISGPYIQVVPGNGAPQFIFEGQQKAPLIGAEEGLKVTLMAPQLGSLKAGSPIYYRGIQVGAIEDFQLADDARMVNIHIHIRRRYAPLVRTGTMLWNASGVRAEFGLFRGAQIQIESLESTFAGGIAFATPSAKDAPARSGMLYRLYEKPQDEWLDWAPTIELEPDGMEESLEPDPLLTSPASEPRPQ